MDLATAIDTVLSSRLAEMMKRSAGNGGDITATLEEAATESGMALPVGVSVVDVSPTLAALQLVVNALCYVAAYPEDIDTVWPEGTPDSLKQKALNSKGKEQMRAKSKLTALGYVPVHICGKRVAEQGFDFGHSVLGGDSYEIVHLAFKFRGFGTYNVLVNPSDPVVREVECRFLARHWLESEITPMNTHLATEA